MAKKVLKYTEEEFVTLLENIVKRVKKVETPIFLLCSTIFMDKLNIYYYETYKNH